MNYLQLDKCIVLKYWPLQSAVTLKTGSDAIQDHWKFNRSYMTCLPIDV